jgi:hypothetical protein
VPVEEKSVADVAAASKMTVASGTESVNAELVID